MCLFVCMCELWSSKPVVLNKQESLDYLRILIIVVDMVSIFFTHKIHGWASLPFTTSKIIKVREKKQFILSTWLSVVFILFSYSDLICYRKSGRASVFSNTTSILMAATRGRWFTVSSSFQLFTVDQSSYIMLLSLFPSLHLLRQAVHCHNRTSWHYSESSTLHVKDLCVSCTL